MHYLGKTLLVFALLHSAFQGQICLLLQVFLDFNTGVVSDSVPEELWMKIRDHVQETGVKTIPMEKKCKKAKWLSEEALQMAEKGREVKSKGEKERYTV